MRRLVAGASARCCILVAFLAFAVGAGAARASKWQDLDERIAELEAGAPRERQSYWDVVSEDLGRVALGFQSPATDDITIIYDPRIIGFPCLFDDPVDPGKCGGNPSDTTKLPAASWQGFCHWSSHTVLNDLVHRHEFGRGVRPS
jgi:hypothetical protein